MRDLAAVEIRRLHRKVADTDRRLSLVDLPGKVKAGSQDKQKRTLRLVIGQSADGKEILSPPVRWQEPGAGKLKIHTQPKDGEQMYLQSPSGTLGGGSRAVWGTFDKDNPAPSTDSDATVIDYEGTRITLRKKECLVERGKAKALVRDDMVRGRIKEARYVAKEKGAKIRMEESWVAVDGKKVIVSHPPIVGEDPIPDQDD